jgi:hypothetical protein
LAGNIIKLNSTPHLDGNHFPSSIIRPLISWWETFCKLKLQQLLEEDL